MTLISLKDVPYLTKREGLAVVAILAFFYAIMFTGYYHREIAEFPPDNYDQGTYLLQAYTIQDDVFHNGPRKIFKDLVNSEGPQGLLFPIEGSILSALFGGGRFGALLLNLIAFVSLQFVLYRTIVALIKDPGTGVAAVALLGSCGVVWMNAGGPFDFRMDFLAFALYGIWVCFVLRSDVFADRQWSTGATAIALLLILNRYIAMVYVGLVMLILFLFLLLMVVVKRDLESRRRAFHVFLSGASIIAVMVPIFIFHWDIVWNYYGVGHITSGEKYVRAAELGIHSLAGHLKWYIHSLFDDMLGKTYLVVGSLLVASAFFSPHKEKSALLARVMGFLVLVCLTLYGVLTAAISKSPVVGSIFVVPFTLLFILIVASYVGAQLSKRAVAIVVSASLAVNAVHALYPAIGSGPREERWEWAQLSMFLQTEAMSRNNKAPKVFADTVLGRVSATAMAAYGYERTGQLVQFVQIAPTSIAGVTRDWIFQRLAESDYVILTGYPRTSVYPYIESIEAVRPEIRAWANENLVVARAFRFSDFSAVVYRAPDAIVEGVSGGWFTAKGISLRAKAKDLLDRPIIWFSGPVGPSVVPNTASSIAMNAIVHVKNETKNLLGEMSFQSGRYEAKLDTTSVIPDVGDDVVIDLVFDRFFVPKEIGMNSDTRQLVVLAQDRVRLVKK